MAKPIGSLVGLYYDPGERLVDEGDVIRTPTGRSYRVVGVREQRSRVHPGRLQLRCVVIDPDDVTDDDVVHPLHWYSRG